MNKISIVYDENLKYWLTVNDCPIDEVLTYQNRLSIYKKSILMFERDITNAYQKSKKERLSEFQWLITCKNLRPDGLVDVIFFYYLISLIKHIENKSTAHHVINLSTFVPIAFEKYLKLNYGNRLIARKNYYSKLRYVIRLWLHPLKRIKQIKHLIKLRAPKKKQGLLFIQSGSDFRKTRWGGFDKYYFSNKCIVFPKDLFHGVSNIPDKSALISLKFTSFVKLLLKAAYVSIKVQIKIQKNKEKSLWTTFFKEQVFSQTLFVVFRQLITDKILSEYQPSEVIVSQTFGDPMSRYLTFSAQKLGIKSTIFSCRSMITSLRPEDRILPVEIDGENTLYGIGDQVYLFDKFSKRTLQSFGYPSNRIKYYKNNVQVRHSEKIEKGLLFLLTDPRTNLKLLSSLKGGMQNNNFKIYLKRHPLAKFSQEEKLLVSHICPDSIDLSQKKLNEMNLMEVVAFTTYSTSGVEATSRGSGLVWLPFLTERCIQFSAVFDTIGEVAYSKNKLKEILHNLNDDNYFSALINRCNLQYQEHFDMGKSI